MEGKQLLNLFMKLGPKLPEIMDMESNVIVWATDKEEYTMMHVPQTKEWEAFQAKTGEPIRAGIGPVVIKNKKACHAVIPSDVFGIPIRAAGYPIIENDEVIGVIGISFGLSLEKNIADLSTELSKLCTQFLYK